MSIWQTPISIESLNDRNQGTLADFLGIEYIDIGDNSLSARMQVTARHKQPIGIMHGGVSCVLAETVGSNAANYAVDRSQFYCVGLDINTNHIRSVREGYVIAIATPYHLGRSTQVWGIDIHTQDQQLVSVNRLTMAVLPAQ